MAKTVKLSPLTRVEGHLEVEVTVDVVNNRKQVIDAKTMGTMFRGFEMILAGRDPRDAIHYTERVCGVCPVSHGMAASLALENAFSLAPSHNGRIVRNLVLGANFIQSHILHFYHLAAPDYISTEGLLDMSPWKPRYSAPDLIAGEAASKLVEHYIKALEMRRKAHQMGAIYAGKLPIATNFVPGGSSAIVHVGNIGWFRTLLDELRLFIDDVFLPDVEALKTYLPEYLEIGRGYGNLLAYGVFQLDAAGESKFISSGRYAGGETGELDLDLIKEYVPYSWFSQDSGDRTPSEGITDPDPEKQDAYTWIKAPRYTNDVYEVGPLARMWVNGDYRNGISVLDRLSARALETKKIADAMSEWLDELEPDGPVYNHGNAPDNCVGIGLTEAPRGALGHWMKADDGAISRYQIITPTAWNASPKDEQGQRGALEEALIGTPVRNMSQPVEVLRVVHSFDPCLACAVHMVRPAMAVLFALLVFLFGSNAYAADADNLATVGDPGNPADETGIGDVAVEYRIGRYEVTNAEYAAFLNAVASSDPNDLFNPAMDITRSGTEGSYLYAASDGEEPVTHVSFYDALRYVNWLHNGRPEGGQDAATTEDGAYTFDGPEKPGPRNAGALFFVPNDNEWYKAAYYNGGAAGGYRVFPTVSGAVPMAADPAAGAEDSANYDRVVGGVTVVGAYAFSENFYGTYDQTGNVWEWVETEADSERRVIRGGSWDDYKLLLESWYRDSEKPDFEAAFIGFRIAARREGDVLFVRGDVNQDGRIDIADAVTVLSYLFSGTKVPGCLSAADSNDDGGVDIADAVSLLTYLFGEIGPLPAPFMKCGADPSRDALSCWSYTPCAGKK